MSEKPSVASGYDPDQLDACRRVLADVHRGLGPLRDAIYLISGLAPAIRDPNPPENVPPHIGTLDIDLYVDTNVLPNEAAYHSLKENLLRMGFVRGQNAGGSPQHHRWEREEPDGNVVSINPLCDVPEVRAGTPVPLPDESGLSAIAIPASGLVTHDFVERSVRVEDRDRQVDLDEDVRVAGIAVSIVLKAYAFEQRRLGKDAYDIVWSLRSHPTGPVGAGRTFAEKAAAEVASGHHVSAIEILRRRFTSEDGMPASRKDGPAMYAEFTSEERVGDENRRRRQEAVRIVGQFVASVDQSLGRAS